LRRFARASRISAAVRFDSIWSISRLYIIPPWLGSIIYLVISTTDEQFKVILRTRRLRSAKDQNVMESQSKTHHKFWYYLQSNPRTFLVSYAFRSLLSNKRTKHATGLLADTRRITKKVFYLTNSFVAKQKKLLCFPSQSI
jgi:hypothetical protein